MKKENQIDIGATIKAGRKRKGWEQKELAELLDVSPFLILSWETNTRTPTDDDLIDIANLLDIVELFFPNYSIERKEITIGTQYFYYSVIAIILIKMARDFYPEFLWQFGFLPIFLAILSYCHLAAKNETHSVYLFLICCFFALWVNIRKLLFGLSLSATCCLRVEQEFYGHVIINLFVFLLLIIPLLYSFLKESLLPEKAIFAMLVITFDLLLISYCLREIYPFNQYSR